MKLQCGHSNHERIGVISTLFVLFFHLFYSYFLHFSRTSQSHSRTAAMTQTFFLLFSVFLSFHATRLRRFSARGYTCIPNNVGGFFGENQFAFTEVTLGFLVHHEMAYSRHRGSFSAALLPSAAFLHTNEVPR